MRQFYITLDQEEYPEKQKGDKEKWKEHFIQENIGIFLKNRDMTGRRIDSRLERIFQTIFYGPEDERFYQESGSDMGYLEDTGNHDVRTEGMSYGMMVCVQMNKQKEFDRLWKWVCTYMRIQEGPEKIILYGLAVQMERLMLMVRRQMGKNFLQWLFSSPLIDGATEKGFLITVERPEKSFGSVSIRENRDIPESLCGTGQQVDQVYSRCGIYGPFLSFAAFL